MKALQRWTCLTCGLLLATASTVSADDAAPAAERVTFKSSDGVEVVGDYYAPPEGKKKAPCAICVHMYPSDRTSWKPLVPDLHQLGFAVLAYDIRGAGESILPENKYLRRLYSDRDTKLFSEAYRDAEAAAKWLGKKKQCDADRIVMIGASVGCSISIDYAGRDPHVLGVVCLSPGKDYMGIDSFKQIKKLGTRPVLLISPEAEKAAPQALAKRYKAATVEIKPGDADLHGTAMLAAGFGPALMKQIAEFADQSVSSAPAATPPAATPPAGKKTKKS